MCNIPIWEYIHKGFTPPHGGDAADRAGGRMVMGWVEESAYYYKKRVHVRTQNDLSHQISRLRQ